MVMLGIGCDNTPLDGGEELLVQQIIEYNDTSKLRETYSVNIADLTGTYNVFQLKNATTTNTSATMYIYNIWLEE